MLVLIAILVGLGVITAVGSKLLSRGEDAPIETKETCATCDGDNDKCEQTCMMEAAVKGAPEYFDDEELDRFKGRQSDDYDDDEAEMFRDVMYTMRRDEVVAWNRSLILRGVNLPNQVKDEVIMLIGDTQ